MADWTELFGAELTTKDGTKSTTEVLNGKKVVGIYFSAHWCPPCRAFTPVLGTVYDDMVEEHEEFEIVFVSSDRDQKGFDDYFGEMPWKALPFSNQNGKQALATKFGVSGIPMLVFLNAKGEIISTQGRNVISGANGDIEKIWAQLTQ